MTVVANPITTPSTRRAAFGQLCFKLDAEITGLQLKHQQASETIAASDAELDTLSARDTDRAAKLAQARLGVQQSQRAYTDQQAYAQRALDTAVEQEATERLRELNLHLKAAKIKAANMEKTCSEEAQIDHARRDEVTATMLKAHADVKQAARTLAEAQAVKKRAYEELGQEERNEHKVWLDASEARIQALRTEIHAEKQRRVEYLEETAFPALEEWPTYLHEMRKYTPFASALTLTLEGLVNALQSMLADPQGIPPVLNTSMSATARWSGGDVSQLLALPVDEIRNFLRGSPGELKQRLARCQNLLAEMQVNR